MKIGETVYKEIDRLTGIYQQKGVSILIKTAADEIVKLRRELDRRITKEEDAGLGEEIEGMLCG